MTATLLARQLANALSEAAGGGVRIEREENERVGPSCVRLIDARGRADEAVLRLGDHERWPRAHDPTTLLENHLEAARDPRRRRALWPGPTAQPDRDARRGLRPSTPLSERRRRRLRPSSADFRSRTRRCAPRGRPLLRAPECRRSGMTRSSPVKEARSRGCRRGRGIACSGSPRPRSCPRGHARSQAGPASKARPAISRSATSRARPFASASSPQTKASSSGGSCRAEGRCGERVEARDDRRRPVRPGSVPRATWPRASRRTPEGVKRSSDATRQKWVRPDGLPKDLARCRASRRRWSRARRGPRRERRPHSSPLRLRALRAAAAARAASREPRTTS